MVIQESSALRGIIDIMKMLGIHPGPVDMGMTDGVLLDMLGFLLIVAND